MNELKVTINETELPIKEYQGQRVVTLKEIDTVHERPEGTARKRFNDNKKHFIDGVDFFQLDQPSEIRTLGFERPQGGTPQSVTLITESGYLMLVKSFTDDLAWAVQRQLVNTYFRAAAANPDPRPDRAACTDTHPLKVFENPDNPYMHSLRVIMIGSEPWFVGKDVVLAVGYRGTKGILDGHVLQRNLLRTNPKSMLVSTRILLDKCGPHVLDLLEQMWFPTLVNVPGLFDLIHSCTRPRVRDFEAWLRERILPALQVELPQSERPALPTPAPRPGKKEPPADPAQGNRLIGSICCMLANADLPTLNAVFRFLSESQT